MSHTAPYRARECESRVTLLLRDADSGQIDHMAAEHTHGPHHPCTSSSWLGARGTLLAIDNFQLNGGSTGNGFPWARERPLANGPLDLKNRAASPSGSVCRITQSQRRPGCSPMLRTPRKPDLLALATGLARLHCGVREGDWCVVATNVSNGSNGSRGGVKGGQSEGWEVPSKTFSVLWHARRETMAAKGR